MTTFDGEYVIENTNEGVFKWSPVSVEGRSIKEICDYFKVSSIYVRRVIVDNGIEIRSYGGRRVISESIVAEARRLFKSGKYSIKDLNEKYGVTGISYWLDGNHIENRNNAIRYAYSKGSTIEGLAKEFSVSSTTVKKVLKDILRGDDCYKVVYGVNDLDLFKELVDSGYSRVGLREKFNCGDGAINTALKRLGLKIDSRIDYNKYKWLYDMNLEMSQHDMSKKTGIPQPTIASKIVKYKKQNNIPLLKPTELNSLRK